MFFPPVMESSLVYGITSQFLRICTFVRRWTNTKPEQAAFDGNVNASSLIARWVQLGYTINIGKSGSCSWIACEACSLCDLNRDRARFII